MERENNCPTGPCTRRHHTSCELRWQRSLGTFSEYEDTNEGYDLAKKELANPFSFIQKDLLKAKELYTVHCGICHGAKGAGQGILVKREKILGVPSYADPGRAITSGSTYHVIYYGKNSMGSYANQLNEKERWMVTDYVMKLKSDLSK